MPSILMQTDGSDEAAGGNTEVADERKSPAEASSYGARNAIELTRRGRRKVYLDTHPEYFSSALELADPLLYDRCIRKFQTATEREAEGREKGFSGVLMSDLCRNEAKASALAEPDPRSPLAYPRRPDGGIVEEERSEAPLSKEEGAERWRRLMSWRFLRGDDDSFDYEEVDDNEAYDDLKEQQRDTDDQYFGQQSPHYEVEPSELQGQTGIQDF